MQSLYGGGNSALRHFAACLVNWRHLGDLFAILLHKPLGDAAKYELDRRVLHFTGEARGSQQYVFVDVLCKNCRGLGGNPGWYVCKVEN